MTPSGWLIGLYMHSFQLWSTQLTCFWTGSRSIGLLRYVSANVFVSLILCLHTYSSLKFCKVAGKDWFFNLRKVWQILAEFDKFWQMLISHRIKLFSPDNQWLIINIHISLLKKNTHTQNKPLWIRYCCNHQMLFCFR